MTMAEWDCDGQRCSCHDPSLCSECGCTHNEIEAQAAEALMLADRETLFQANDHLWAIAIIRRLNDHGWDIHRR